MSDIATIKADLMSKIDAATGLTSQSWSGEEVALSAARPAVFVQWRGAATQVNQEIGAVSYAMDTVFVVLVSTEDTFVGLTPVDGDVTAAEYLEQIRRALNGIEIGGLGVANPHPGEFGGSKTESLIDVHAGVYLYGQAWAIEQMID